MNKLWYFPDAIYLIWHELKGEGKNSVILLNDSINCSFESSKSFNPSYPYSLLPVENNDKLSDNKSNEWSNPVAIYDTFRVGLNNFSIEGRILKNMIFE